MSQQLVPHATAQATPAFDITQLVDGTICYDTLLLYFTFQDLRNLMCVSRAFKKAITRTISPKEWNNLISDDPNTTEKRKRKVKITYGFEAWNTARPSILMYACFNERKCALCFNSFNGKCNPTWHVYAHAYCITKVTTEPYIVKILNAGHVEVRTDKTPPPLPARRKLNSNRHHQGIPVDIYTCWKKKHWSIPDIWTIEGFSETKKSEQERQELAIVDRIKTQHELYEQRQNYFADTEEEKLAKKQKTDNLRARKIAARRQRMREAEDLFNQTDPTLWATMLRYRLQYSILGDLNESKIRCRTKINDNLVQKAVRIIGRLRSRAREILDSEDEDDDSFASIENLPFLYYNVVGESDDEDVEINVIRGNDACVVM